MGSKNKNIAHRSRIIDHFLSKFKKVVTTPPIPDKTLDEPTMASLMNPAAILAPPAALPHSQPVSCRAPYSPRNALNGQVPYSSGSRCSSDAGSSSSTGDSGRGAADSSGRSADSVDSAAGSSATSGRSRRSGGGGGRGPRGGGMGDEEDERMRRTKRSPDDFIFGKIIGEGSFSTVYLAMDVRTRKEYALKVCNKQHILREKKARDISRERDLMAEINNQPLQTAPFFVRMYSSFQDNTRLFFELTYAKNGELFSHIQKVGSFDEKCTQFYAGEILHALEHMHSLGIIHRDLKPENILLDANMHILITDFGCAKSLFKKEETRGNGSRRCSFVGTAQYISPELLNDGETTRACDLWAYGAIIYQMVAGLPPFRGGTDWNIFGLIKELKYEFPEGFNPTTKDLVQKLLVLDPKNRLGACDDDRYTSIREHPFFDGLVFETLYQQQPPPIYPYLPGSTEHEALRSNYRVPANLEPGLSDKQVTRLLGLELGASLEPTERRQRSLLGLSSMTERDIERRLVEQKAADPRWHGLCEGNLILKRGHVNKKRGLFSRRRMLLLTLGPHLYYADSDTMTLKGEIPWSPELRVECKSFKIFFVHTPNRTYYLQDPEGYALEWTKAIEEVRLYMYGNST